MSTYTLARSFKQTHKPGENPWSVSRMVALLVLAVLAASWLVPFAWSVLTSLKSEADAGASTISLNPPDGFSFDAYRKVLSAGDIPSWAWNSLLTSVAITFITVATSALAGYAFSRVNFKGKRLLYAAVIAAIIIPPQLLIVPLFRQMLAFDLVDTYWGIILPQAFAPAMVLILKRFFDQIPVELEEAARVDGASRLRVFWSIVLPLSRPILAAVAIFVFIGAWNNFLWPFIVTTDAHLMTLPVGLQTVKSAYGLQLRAEHGVGDPGRAAAGRGVPVLPAPDHQGDRHHRLRWSVDLLRPGFRKAGFRSPSLENIVTLSNC